MARVKKLNPATGQKEWVTSTGTIERLGGDPSKQFSDYNFGTGKKASDTSTSGNPYAYVDSKGKTRTRTSTSTPTASAPATGGKTYTYVDKTGASKSFVANSAEEALANRPSDADPRSGVSLVAANPVLQTTTGTQNGFLSSSDSIRNREMETAQGISDYLKKFNAGTGNILPDINSSKKALQNSYDDANALIMNRADTLRQRGMEVMAGLNESFNVAAEKMSKTQERASGKFAVGLARIGGYLGNSASAMGAMKNLEQEHAFERADLEAKRAAAIVAAQDAENDAEFDLAKLALQQAQDYDAKIRQAEQDFFNNTLSLSREIRTQQSEERDFKMKSAERLIEVAVETGENISPEDIASASSILGVPAGSLQKYIDAKYQTKQLEEGRKGLNAQLDLLKYVNSFPKGDIVKIGGTEYVSKGGTSGNGDAFTISDLKSTGLPMTLFGYSKSRIVEQVVSTTDAKDIPDWFKETIVSTKDVADPTTYNFSSDWKQFRTDFVNALKEDDVNTDLNAALQLLEE